MQVKFSTTAMARPRTLLQAIQGVNYINKSVLDSYLNSPTPPKLGSIVTGGILLITLAPLQL